MAGIENIGERKHDPTLIQTESIASINNNELDADEGSIKNRFTHVRVVHNFRGSNNDELCMKKDDIITLTQTPSGGWWEGTLHGITGWFPSNYVQPLPIYDPPWSFQNQNQQQSQSGNNVRPDSANGMYPGEAVNVGDQSSINQNNHLSSENPHLAEYRTLVMSVIEESETNFIQSLQDAINHYLMPIYQFKILPTETELNAVLRSITEICSVHRRFLNSIEKIKALPLKDSRVGGLFMQYAPQFKHAHFEYCSHHSKFVHVIEKYKKEICAFFAANPQPTPHSLAQTLASPSHQISSSKQSNLTSMPNVQITALLSVSFRRLDKYPALLQELQRYTEENHADRGDIQRAGFVFREISMSCLELRRRKEMELEVMLGNIKNFDNLNIETFGQIIKMEPVSLLILSSNTMPETPKKDYYFVLFPKVLMILSVGKEMTSFTFESMIKLEGAKLQPINLPAIVATNATEIQTFPLEISGFNAHPEQQQEAQQISYVVGFPDEDVLREYYHSLQKQIRHQNVPPLLPPPAVMQQQSEQSSMSMSSSASNLPPNNSGGVASSSSSTSSSAIFSPQSSSISITSPDQPVPSNLPPKPPHYRAAQQQTQTEPQTSFHYRPPPIPPPSSSNSGVNGSIEIALQSLPKRTSFWSEQMLTPHTPYRPPVDSMNSNQINILESNMNHLHQNQEPNDDMQLFNVIDAYHRKFLSGSSGGSRGSGIQPGGNDPSRMRKLSNPEASDSNSVVGYNNLIELEPYHYVEIIGITSRLNQISGSTGNTELKRNPSARKARKHSLTMLANKINKLSLSSMDRDILYEIYDQLRVIRNEMGHLTEKFRDERRQRKRLQNSVAKLHQHHQQQQQQQQQNSNI